MPKPKGTEAWRANVASWLDGQPLYSGAYWYRPEPVAANGHPCDCCQSKRPETLYKVYDQGGREYAIGDNCWQELERTGRYHIRQRPQVGHAKAQQDIADLWGPAGEEIKREE